MAASVYPGKPLDNSTRWDVITDASVEVGPALFISLLIITLSFIPIFTLRGAEGATDFAAGFGQKLRDGGRCSSLSLLFRCR